MAPRTRKSLLLKGNGPFLDLPLDILFEIFKLSHPLSLVYLSRTNKALRDYLLDRQNAAIWRASFEGVEGSPPKCPPYSCEPEWTRLLFEEVCHVCLEALEHDGTFDPIWWEFRTRYCSECAPDQLLTQLPKTLVGQKRPYSRNYTSPWRDVFPCIQGFYLAKDVHDFIAKYSVLNDADGKANLIQERRETTKALSGHAHICRRWMDGIVKARQRALKDLKNARWAAIETKLHEAGWPNSLIVRHEWEEHTLAAIQRPLSDAEWREIGPKFIAELEASVRPRVMRKRIMALEEAFPRRVLDTLTKDLTFRPRIVDIAAIADVHAVLDVDLKVDVPKEDLKTKLEPLLPALLTLWSSTFETKLREHTRAWLEAQFPDAAIADPFEHALAYFASCSAHFPEAAKTAMSQLNRANSLFEARTIDQTINEMFRLGAARAVLEDVIKAYGKDPQSVTCAEMDAAPGTLLCMRCTERNQPTGWRDAYGHGVRFHEKVSSLKPRFVVELEE
ncbi:hypothetical protein DFH07DRAFT_802998 [Mycena maculata]|uniref:F-box domain-containing protein n=1 Tax=Mycena maculata TaxID=230809 RepID=A0AAD7NS85_9AGAR|nr:hypothetical protein DFH07DRAFT_802998 [Mycena maculata]